MTRWIRKSRGFAAAAMAVAMLLALQLIVTSAVASQMQVTNLLLGTAEGPVICLSDEANADGSGRAQLVHKTTCDICTFAAQPGAAAAPLFALLSGDIFHVAEMPFPRVLQESTARHEPRLTRGPPLNA
jgi:hypothetical protein